MFTKQARRYVSYMLLFFMLFTIVPVQAFAETDSHEGHDHSIETVVSTSDSAADSATEGGGIASGDSTETGDATTEGDSTETGDVTTEGDSTETSDATTEGGSTENSDATTEGDGTTDSESETGNGDGTANGEGETGNGDGKADEEGAAEEEQPAEPVTLEAVTAQADVILAACLMLENPTPEELEAALAELIDEESIKAAVAALDAPTVQIILADMENLDEQAAQLSEEDYAAFEEQYAILADFKAALEEAAAALEQPEETVTLAQVQDAAAALFTTYVGNANPTAEEIQAAVEAMDQDTVQAALAAIAEVEAQAALLNEEDAAVYAENNAVLAAFKAALEAKAEEQPEKLSKAYYEVQAMIDDMLNWYLGSTEVTQEEIEAIVAGMDETTIREAYVEIFELEEWIVEQLNEDEIQVLLDNNFVVCDFATSVVAHFAGISLYTTVNVLDGKVSVTDSTNSMSESGGTVTITAKGSLFSKKTNNVTITNESGKKAELTFDYTASSASSFQIADDNAAASGNYRVILEAGASLSIQLVSNSGISNTTATLTLRNISLTEVKEESNVTFVFDDTLGSVTVAGETVASGDIKNVSGTDGVELKATPISGATFLGWVDADGKIISQTVAYKLVPAADMTVKAVFAKDGGTPWFGVGGTSQKSVSSGLLGLSKLYYDIVSVGYLYDDLNTAAASANGNAIVLMNDGTLPAGDYTIPSDKTLLIPFDSENSLYTTYVLNTGDSAWVLPTAYRTLTMAAGSNLIVNGAMSLSAKQRTAQGSKTDGGSPTGPVSFVEMEDGSNITVNSGGALHAYGFITGSGSVTVNSGASVYEMFQMMDFRGGSQSTDMENGVFALSQYYVQNIEVPMTLYSGATEYSYTTVYMSNADFGSSVAFIAKSGAMFNLTDGYVIKDYDEATDRLVVDAYGDMQMSSINMSVGTSSINSKNYELPINSNITVNIYSGSITINQDIAMLPGAVINVSENAKCTLGNGNNVYIYDADEWGNYCGPGNKKFIPITYAPGRIGTRTEADLVDAKIVAAGTLDASNGGIYTTAGGAAIVGKNGATANIKSGQETKTYQLVQGTGYTEIPITSAKLLNEDGSYTETAGIATAKSFDYKDADGDGDSEWVTCQHTNKKASTEEGAVAEKEATCEEPGHTGDWICLDCSRTIEDELIPALGHAWGTATYTWTDYTACTATRTCANDASHVDNQDATITSSTKAATCDNAGKIVYTAAFTAEGLTTQTKEETIPAKGHNYGDAVYTWSEDNNSCTASRTCANDASHVETVTATVTSETVNATCNAAGSTVYTATFNSDVNWVTTQTKTAEITAAGHNYNVTYEWEGYTACNATAICHCGDTVTEAGSITIATKDATCTEEGEITYTATFENNLFTAQSVTEILDAAGHAFGNPTYSWSDDKTTCTASRTCTKDDNHVETETVTTSYVVTVEPDCIEKGEATYTATFKNTGLGSDTKKVDIDALDHDYNVTYEWAADNSSCTATWTCNRENCDAKDTETVTAEIEETTKVSCTADGLTTYTADFTNERFVDQTKEVTIKSEGHRYGEVTYDWNTENPDAVTCTASKTCKVCDSATEGYKLTATGAVTIDKDASVSATCTTAGKTVYTATFNVEWATGDKTEVTVTAYNHDYTAVEYKWSEDYATCTATRVCNHDSNHVETQTVTADEKSKTDATCTEKGKVVYYADFTDYGFVDQSKTVEIPETGHNYGAPEYIWDTIGEVASCTAVKECIACATTVSGHTVSETGEVVADTEKSEAADCTNAGKIVYNAVFTDKDFEAQTTEKTVPALNHDYTNAEISYIWSANYDSCTASRNCVRTTCTHADTENATITINVINATCTEDGKTVYTATFKNTAFAEQTEEVTIGQTGHAYGEVNYVWSGDNSECTATRVCANNTAHVETETVKSTSETTDATCTETGKTVYKAVFENTVFAEQTKEVTIAASGHVYGKAAYDWNVAEDGTVTCIANKACEKCDAETTGNVVTENALIYEDESESKAATCVESGQKVYLAVFSEAFENQKHTVEIDAIGHAYGEISYIWDETDKENITCTASRSCTRTTCNAGIENHVETENVAVIVNVTDEAQCLTNGAATYISEEFVNTAFAKQTKDVVLTALGHDLVYEGGTAATCLEEGTHAGAYCSRCDYTEGGGVIQALGHSWGKETIIKVATCLEAGEKQYTCTRNCCDNVTKTEPISALGHEYGTVTYTFSEDYTLCTAERHCVRTTCNDSVEGHTQQETTLVTEDVKTKATCSNPGQTVYTAVFYEYPDVFGTKVSSRILPATGHAYGEPEYAWNEDNSECIATMVCANDANHVVSEKAVITSKTTAAGCNAAGKVEYTATFTNEAFEVQKAEKVLEAAGHSYGKASYEWGKDAEGNVICIATMVCTKCTEGEEGRVVSEEAEVTSETTDATCTGNGKTVYTATFTNTAFTVQTKTETITETGHSYGEPIYEWSEDYSECSATRVCVNNAAHVETETVTATSSTTAAGCNAAGKVEYTATFTNEAFEVQKAEKVLEAAGHSYGKASYEWGKDAEGNVICTATMVCTKCAEGEEGRIVSEEAEVISETTDATCTGNGKTVYTATFTNTAFTVQTKTETITETGHSYGEPVYEWSKDKNENVICTATRTCANNDSHVEAETVTATSSTTAAGCTEDGKIVYTAIFKNTAFTVQTKEDAIGQTGHKYGTVSYVWSEDNSECTATRICRNDVTHIETETVKSVSITTDAECTVDGVTVYTATFKNTAFVEQTKEVAIGQTGHAYGEVSYVWSEDNSECTATRVCANNAAHVETETVKSTSVTTDAECTVDGVTVYTATFKNTVFAEQTKKTVITHPGHTKEILEAVEATCTKTGLTEGEKCSVCGTVLVEQQVVEKTAHTEEILEAVEATCTKTGLTEGKKCSVCGETTVKQETVPRIPHTEEIVEAVEATCTETGLTAGSKCSVCGRTVVVQKEVEALGHTLVYFDAKNPTYTEPGWEAYELCEVCGYSTLVVIPALGEAKVETYDEFVENLTILENLADTYVKKVSPGKDPAMLVIKYIRTGVDRYNSGSWNIMAGYEDAGFAKYVSDYEANYNANLEEGQPMMAVTGLKNIENFTLPNGDRVDFGHMFGTMDISYTNNNSVDHADVAGFFGDTVDLMSAADRHNVSGSLEEMVADISENYLCNDLPGEDDKFGKTDMYGDLDGFYVIEKLNGDEYENGTLTNIITSYMTESLTDEYRADFYLKNRLNGVTLRTDVRDAVYNAYIANSVIATLEGTREFTTSDLDTLRKACCYSVADYLTRLAGDWVEVTENPYLNVFQSTSSDLAPGITQVINYATTADDQTMVYYIATGDITRDDVTVYANYHNNDPSTGWAMQRVLDQANAAQNKYGNPDSELYIENYNVIASINGDGYNMYTGEPGGLLVMDGFEWHPCDGSGFFAILADGTARIGSQAEYNALKAEDKVKEAIGAFGTTLVKDGKINVTATSDYYTDRASRTAVGITKTGKVVFLVIDGRQGEFSCGASAIEIAQIMLDAGCYQAVNLDGGGSSTYVARPEGETELRVVSSPSDGAARSVATSLLMVSTAASSTAFDRAILDSVYSYLTVGSSTSFSAAAVSATGNVVEMPEGSVWAVSDETIGTITEEGVFTAKANGDVTVNLLLDGEIIGSKTLHVVTPDNIYFEKDAINAIYGHPASLPVRAVYEGKEVAINENDVVLSLGNTAAGIIEGFTFTADETSGLKKATVIAALTSDTSITASLTVALYSEDEASFDFDNATGGDRQLAWNREVTNAIETNKNVYRAIDPAEDMVTSYTFAIDMSKIEIPPQLADLTYMLPGADMENASAWNFLLQLAERISVLSTVTPVLKFDPNFDVDYSELSILNEYFIRNNEVFDEETNTLTLNLSWKDQTEPIDADTANPLCILTGIKLTPKDGTWDNKTQISPLNSGTIGYKIYLRTNALYTFASKPENQEIYGLEPFINPNDEGEKGGAFGSVYKEFEDQYTLINAAKDGWVIEDGGFAYYKEGSRYTGICEVDGYYYDFGENGVNIGKKPYTGVMTDAVGNEYYLVDGLVYKGWLIVDETNIRYFNPDTGIREKLTADETPSTCIIDGYCIYTTESGEVKRIDYDDAGGHEYVEQADGSNVCSECGWKRVEMPDVNVTLSYYECTYTGTARTPSTTAMTDDGYVLSKPGTSEYPEYSSTYANNVEVGTASVTLKAARYGKYSNLHTWRGNAAGEITVTYEIRPDLPANVVMERNNENVVMSWTAAKASGVTYMIYKSENGTDWTEFARTEDVSYEMSQEEVAGRIFRIGTCKEVDGKNYASLNFTPNVTAGLVVVTGNNADGLPTLKWAAVPDAESYEVYRAISENGKYTNVYNTTYTSYTHASATEGRTYYYYVKAVLADGTEVVSDVVSNSSIVEKVVITVTTGNNADGLPTLKWVELEEAESYEVYRSTVEDGDYVKVFTTKGKTYTHSSATKGKTYYYYVKAVLADGKEAYSEAVSNTYIVPEVVFELTTGHNDAGKPTLKWNNVTGAASYEVYRSTVADGDFVKTFTTKGATYTNTSAVAGNTYYYKVKAILTSGEEIYSHVVSNDCIIPEAVITVATGHNDAGKPTLKWNNVTGAASYEVYRSTAADGDFVKTFTTKGTSYTNTSAVAGNTYYYKVKVILTNGEEVVSDVVSNTCIIPGVVFDITAGHNNAGKPTLRWADIAGAASYEVYRSTAVDGDYVKMFTTQGNTYTNTSAIAGRTYYYKVKVILTNGEEVYSEVIDNTCL